LVAEATQSDAVAAWSPAHNIVRTIKGEEVFSGEKLSDLDRVLAGLDVVLSLVPGASKLVTKPLGWALKGTGAGVGVVAYGTFRIGRKGGAAAGQIGRGLAAAGRRGRRFVGRGRASMRGVSRGLRVKVETYTGRWGGWGRGFLDTGKYSWRSVRRRMGESGFLGKGQHGHHWAIPRGGSGRLFVRGFLREQWGRYVPNVIKNRTWNIMPAPNLLWHHSVHGRGPMAYSIFGRFWHGSPGWAKAATGAGLAYGVHEALNED